MEQNEYFDNYENNLQVELLKLCTSHKMLEGTLLASDDIEERWREYAPEYMADSVGQVNTYPLVAVAWAAYVGMAVAAWWDMDWERYASEPYASLHGERGFDDMDEHIVQHILGLGLEDKQAVDIENVLRSCAQMALNFIRREQIEAQSTKAFYIFARTARVMYRIGAALELARRGYRFEKVNLADMPLS